MLLLRDTIVTVVRFDSVLGMTEYLCLCECAVYRDAGPGLVIVFKGNREGGGDTFGQGHF